MKRLLSAILTVVMVCSLVPEPALAEMAQELQDAGPTVAPQQTEEVAAGQEEPPSDVLAANDPATNYPEGVVSVQSDDLQGTYTSLQDGVNIAFRWSRLDGDLTITDIEVQQTENPEDMPAAGSVHLQIPKYVISGDQPVKAITAKLLGYATNEVIGKITFPNTIESIDGDFFTSWWGYESTHADDLNVTEVSFEENSALEELPSTFMIRSGITTIALPDHLKKIGVSAFRECASLTSIDIPETVEEIGETAFYKSGLTSIELSGSLKTIGKEAFRESKLTTATIDGNDAAIGESAFAYTPLTTVSMGDGIASIGKLAFSDCESLATVSLCENLTTSHLKSIGDKAFSFAYSGTSSLTSIAIPDSVETIGVKAFADPSVSHVWNEELQEPNSGSLKTLVLGSSQEASHLTTIGARAFEGTGIRSVALPNSLQSMGTETEYTFKYGVFHDCSLLETIVVPSSWTAD